MAAIHIRNSLYALKIIHNKCPLSNDREVTLRTCEMCGFLVSGKYSYQESKFGPEISRVSGKGLGNHGRDYDDEITYESFQANCGFELVKGEKP